MGLKIKNSSNSFKAFHRMLFRIETVFRLNETRTDRYIPCFYKYCRDSKIILDIGCGSGEFCRAFVNEGKMVIGLDLDGARLKKIKCSTLQLVCADAQKLPFRKGSVDCILSLSVVEHLETPEVHVKEVHRLLENGGVAVFQLPNLQYLFEPHTKVPLLYLLPHVVQSKIFKLLNYAYVNMNVSLKYFIETLENEGLHINVITKIYHLRILKLLPIAPCYIFVLKNVNL